MPDKLKSTQSPNKTMGVAQDMKHSFTYIIDCNDDVIHVSAEVFAKMPPKTVICRNFKSRFYFGDLVRDVGEQEISAESRENTAVVITLFACFSSM